MNNTKVLNLFSGPGTSKSTTCSNIFSLMKRLHIKCELAREYAKELVFAEDWQTLNCQPYVTATQLKRQFDLLGKVEVVISDSPILLGLFYGGFGTTPGWRQGVIEQFHLFDNINIFLERNLELYPYQNYGRMQTETEAVEKDKEIKALLDEQGIEYITIPVLEGDQSARKIVEYYQTLRK